MPPPTRVVYGLHATISTANLAGLLRNILI